MEKNTTPLQKKDFDFRVKRFLHEFCVHSTVARVSEALAMVESSTAGKSRDDVRSWPAYLATLLRRFDPKLYEILADRDRRSRVEQRRARTEGGDTFDGSMGDGDWRADADVDMDMDADAGATPTTRSASFHAPSGLDIEGDADGDGSCGDAGAERSGSDAEASPPWDTAARPPPGSRTGGSPVPVVSPLMWLNGAALPPPPGRGPDNGPGTRAPGNSAPGLFPRALAAATAQSAANGVGPSGRLAGGEARAGHNLGGGGAGSGAGGAAAAAAAPTAPAAACAVRRAFQ